MGRTKLQFWLYFWSIGFFILTVRCLVTEGNTSELEAIPKATASLKVDPVDVGVLGELECVTRFVGSRTKENLEGAIEEVKRFLEENLGEELSGSEMTQLQTFAMISQSFYEKQAKIGVDLHSVKKLVIMLRPYEIGIGESFLNLQELYREVLLQREGFFESAAEDFLVEARAVFYFFDDSHRPYLVAGQANWVLRLKKKYDIEGDEFQGYLERALNWKKRQPKRALSSSKESSNGDSSSVSTSSDKELAPKRKWGNKGFHSHVGMSSHRSVYQHKYGGGKKGGRFRSSSW
ncbi:MAG TPA: hypothetical protein DD412_08815 [Holosporales bacterium]|nr:hypothetical protein [Holosporales bacterium]